MFAAYSLGCATRGQAPEPSVIDVAALRREEEWERSFGSDVPRMGDAVHMMARGICSAFIREGFLGLRPWCRSIGTCSSN